MHPGDLLQISFLQIRIGDSREGKGLVKFTQLPDSRPASHLMSWLTSCFYFHFFFPIKKKKKDWPIDSRRAYLLFPHMGPWKYTDSWYWIDQGFLAKGPQNFVEGDTSARITKSFCSQKSLGNTAFYPCLESHHIPQRNKTSQKSCRNKQALSQSLPFS